MSPLVLGLRVFCLTLLLTTAKAAPKTISCMSFMEDDHSVTQDDDEFEEYPSSSYSSLTSEANHGNHFNVESPISAEDISANSQAATATAPHRRICPSDYTFCFSLWRKTDNGTSIEKQGCWKESNGTCNQSECVSSNPTSRNNTLFYCCCSGDNCNKNVSVVEPQPLQLSNSNVVYSVSEDVQQRHDNANKWSSMLWWCSLVVAITLTTVLATFFYCRTYFNEKSVPEEAPLAPSGPGYSSNLRNVDNINLVSMLGSGKYGTVMKGILHDQEVAVKIYPEPHYQYYINERNIYSLPMMDCPALLSYLGYDERHTMEGKVEYQLVLSLAPLGCLQDWLIANICDFEVFSGMVKSITRGLSHLHTELKRGEELKPCIAHRDFNTRNILVKADMTCCIADFGFALKVFGSRYEYKGEVAMAETKSINEVGTLRYMSPELLEGAVNLRDCETSLKQMDVYALGLVLWEVASRCSHFYVPAQTIAPYKAPYELEVGSHPSFDQMQTLVVRHKARPLFPQGWGGGAAAKLIRDTCEDCWDHDAEARLTSLCAEERMHEVAMLKCRSNAHTPASSPLVNPNNLNQNFGNGEKSPAHNSEAASVVVSAPPNQELQLPAVTPSALHHNQPHNHQAAAGGMREKNHFNYALHQIQPYQGRNPCQERNLMLNATRAMPLLVEKSSKHSFQPADENSFSCLEDDISVEQLIAAGNGSIKFQALCHDSAAIAASMGQGFPKQQNTDKKLRGWHGVRALIQKKLARKDCSSAAEEEFLTQLSYGNEKSNLMDATHLSMRASSLAAAETAGQTTPIKTTSVCVLDNNNAQQHNLLAAPPLSKTHNRRPNNLDLSPKSNIIHSSIAEEPAMLQTEASDNGNSALPRSISANLSRTLCNHNNNSISYKNQEHEGDDAVASQHRQHKRSKSSVSASSYSPVEFRRQRSLEVFREVFSGHGSTDRLRDPSQRVKTPGDVPPSVRKIRASKTLSLYDDRMMDTALMSVL